MRENAFVIGGLGMVGKATRKALDIPYYYDVKESNLTLEEGSKKLFCIICLPTPTDEKGSQGKAVDVIRAYIKQIQGYGNRNIFVIRSTVIPGTCRALAESTGAMVVSNPEFLSEATWEEDCIHPRMKVVGADDLPAKIAVVDLWKDVKSKIEISTDTVTSETIKYVFNTFAAVKVVFGNTIYDSCQVTGANYEEIHHALHEHPWGSKHHFKVVDKGGRGAGGRCIPKDLKAFAKFTNSKFLQMVEEVNNEYLQKTHKE